MVGPFCVQRVGETGTGVKVTYIRILNEEVCYEESPLVLYEITLIKL